MPNGSFRNTTWRGTAATKRRIYFASAASLATRGDAAEVASETELKFTLTSPITITERK